MRPVTIVERLTWSGHPRTVISPTHCHHCQTVRKLGPVKKRKRRTIVPRENKPKNKRKKSARTVQKDFRNFLDNLSDEENEQENDEFHDVENDRSDDEESADDSLNWEIGQSMKRKKTVVSRQKEDFVEGGDDVQDHPAESDD